MKKVFYSLVASLFVALLILAPANKALAASEIDQQHTAGGGSVSIDQSLGRFAQIFRPAMSKLDKVEIELTNVVGTKTVNVAIRHRVGTSWDTGDVATISAQTVTTGWNTFDFEDLTLTMSATDTYGIFVGAIQNGPQWKYKSGPSVYDRGYAIWQNQDKVDWDYNFKTYGYEPVAESTTVDNSDGNSAVTSSSQEDGSGESPAEATSVTIKAPSAVKVEYTIANSSNKVTWTKSATTDLDGYKIYRSEEKTKGFKEIGKTNATTYEFTDSQSLAIGKTYYYQIRAYKGSDQSPSSNIAEQLIPTANVASAVANNTAEVKDDKVQEVETVNIEEITPEEQEQYLILGGIAAILLVLLLGLSVSHFRAGKHKDDSHFKLTK